MKFKTFLFENKLPTYKIVNSLPEVTLYHGTLEHDAKKGLKNDDNFNTSWIETIFQRNPIHLTSDIKVAWAYATSGLSRKSMKNVENEIELLQKKIKKEFKVDVNLKKNYDINKLVSSDVYKEATKYFTLQNKNYEKSLETLRGKDGFVIQVNFKPTKIIVFDESWNPDGGYGYLNDIRSIVGKEKGKFDSVLWPNTDLKPENFKGKLPKSDYYLAFKYNQLTNLTVIEK